MMVAVRDANDFFDGERTKVDEIDTTSSGEIIKLTSVSPKHKHTSKIEEISD